jgi:hypothetical protein
MSAITERQSTQRRTVIVTLEEIRAEYAGIMREAGHRGVTISDADAREAARRAAEQAAQHGVDLVLVELPPD